MAQRIDAESAATCELFLRHVQVHPDRPHVDLVLRPFVEPRCGTMVVGRRYPFPPHSSGGVLAVRPGLRFHIPLVGRRAIVIEDQHQDAE